MMNAYDALAQLKANVAVPFTQAADTWQTIPSEPDPNNPTAAPGIFDVKSGSDGTAINGSKYSDNSIW